jgi:hypothetical protein
MVFEEQSKEGEAARERALVARLRQFIEDSELLIPGTDGVRVTERK